MAEKYKTPAIVGSEERAKAFEQEAIRAYGARADEAYANISKIVKERQGSFVGISAAEGGKGKTAPGKFDVSKSLKEFYEGKGLTEREKILIVSFLNNVAK